MGQKIAILVSDAIGPFSYYRFDAKTKMCHYQTPTECGGVHGGSTPAFSIKDLIKRLKKEPLQLGEYKFEGLRVPLPAAISDTQNLFVGTNGRGGQTQMPVQDLNEIWLVDEDDIRIEGSVSETIDLLDTSKHYYQDTNYEQACDQFREMIGDLLRGFDKFKEQYQKTNFSKEKTPVVYFGQIGEQVNIHFHGATDRMTGWELHLKLLAVMKANIDRFFKVRSLTEEQELLASRLAEVQRLLVETS